MWRLETHTWESNVSGKEKSPTLGRIGLNVDDRRDKTCIRLRQGSKIWC